MSTRYCISLLNGSVVRSDKTSMFSRTLSDFVLQIQANERLINDNKKAHIVTLHKDIIAPNYAHFQMYEVPREKHFTSINLSYLRKLLPQFSIPIAEDYPANNASNIRKLFEEMYDTLYPSEAGDLIYSMNPFGEIKHPACAVLFATEPRGKVRLAYTFAKN